MGVSSPDFTRGIVCFGVFFWNSAHSSLSTSNLGLFGRPPVIKDFFDPIITIPKFGIFFKGKSSLNFGLKPPSYHFNFTDLLFLLAGKLNSTVDLSATKFSLILGLGTCPTTELGIPKSKAQKGASSVWHDQSPNCPFPKSKKPLHDLGT